MQPQTVTFRTSRVHRWLAAISFAFLALATIGMCRSRPDGTNWEWMVGGYIILVFSFGSALRAATTSYLYADGVLVRRQFWLRQAIRLDMLVSAKERTYSRRGGPLRLLRLKDSTGKQMRIDLNDFTSVELEPLVRTLQPFVFAKGVDRDLVLLIPTRFTAPAAPPEKVRPMRILWRTTVFLLLPSLLAAILVVMWAVATHQPAFR